VRRLIALLLLAGCASAGAPPGGPERKTPPAIVAITPDSGATNIKSKSVEIQFDEVVSDRAGQGELDKLFLISPRTSAPDVSWHRSRISVKPHSGFRPNTAYRITMLPGLADLRGNVLKETRTILFSTGADFPSNNIPGRIFDWTGQRVAANAYLEAVPKTDTTIAYLAASDTTGQFEIGPLPPGQYLVRGLIDQNSNHVIDRNEKWDSLTVTVGGTNALVELDAIERDSTPAVIDNASRVDSLTIRVSFDKALDPRIPLQPALVHLVRGDSSAIEVTGVQWAAAYDKAAAARQAAADSAKRAATDTGRAAARPPTPPPTPATTGRTPPPAPKPKLPPPEKAIVLTINPSTMITPGTYVLTVKGMRNLVGNSADAHRTFNVARPTAADSTNRARPDSARRPPIRPPR